MHWDWAHLRPVLDALQRIEVGTLKRLAIFMPPRHGKSQLATIRFPVYYLERQPKRRVIVGAYNQTLAEEFSRQARRIARDRLSLNPERTAANDWQTTGGGGIRAAGVGSGVTGHGADLIVIDDPVKSREEANSEAYRNRVWDWYTNDLYTRLEPGGAIVLIQTRWHEDDLAGRILASPDGGGWAVINLPAEAGPDDQIGRAPGAALCPERFDVPALTAIRRVIGEWAYAALYQQRPLPQGGAFFDTTRLVLVDALPASLPQCRAWDLAATPGGDKTAGVRIAGPDSGGLWYVADVVRGDWLADVVRRSLRQTAELDGPRVRIRLPQDPGQAGKDQARQLVQLLAGYYAKAEPVSGDKATRATGLAAQINAGNVRLVRGAWNADFIAELAGFPMGKYDDQVDAAADAFNALALPTAVQMGTLPIALTDFVGLTA